MYSCSASKSKFWEKRQVRPFSNNWSGKVFGVQCFFGFLSCEHEHKGKQAKFGGWLPDDAIVAVREWLDTVKFIKSAQASFCFSFCLLDGVNKFFCNSSVNTDI